MRIFSLSLTLIFVFAPVVSAESPVTIRPPDATYCLQRDPMVFVINSTYDKPLEGLCRIERLNADDKWEAAFFDSNGREQHSYFDLAPLSETRLTWPEDEKNTDLQVSILRLSCSFLSPEQDYQRKLRALEKQIIDLEELGDEVEVDSLRSVLGEVSRTDGSSEAGVSPTQSPPTPTPEPTVTPTPIPREPPFLVHSDSFNAVLCK